MRLIDLSGPDGNAFFIKGLARSWGKQLLDVFDSYFEDIVQYEFLNDPRIEMEVE